MGIAVRPAGATAGDGTFDGFGGIEVWRASDVLARVMAVATVVAALVGITVLDVPPASGAVVITLIPAAMTDVLVRRIPDAWVGLGAIVLLLGLGAAAASGGSVDLVGVAVGALAMTAPVFGLHLVSPASMGFGDVKIAAVLGAALGVVDWQLALSGLALAAGITVCAAVVRSARTIAFGPGLVGGTVVALLAHGMLLGPVTTSGVAG